MSRESEREGAREWKKWQFESVPRSKKRPLFRMSPHIVDTVIIVLKHKARIFGTQTKCRREREQGLAENKRLSTEAHQIKNGHKILRAPFRTLFQVLCIIQCRHGNAEQAVRAVIENFDYWCLWNAVYAFVRCKCACTRCSCMYYIYAEHKCIQYRCFVPWVAKCNSMPMDKIHTDTHSHTFLRSPTFASENQRVFLFVYFDKILIATRFS